MKKVHVQLTLNGSPAEFLAEPRQTLLECLRDNLNMTGTKEGCGDGNCGSCCVLLDGQLVTSCLVLGDETEGQRVDTVEGIAQGSTLHPIQKAFIDHAALQCGICTPGFLMATKALLHHEPNPTEPQIRLWLANNLCRCTGYDKIVRAVQIAAAEMRGAN